MTDQANPLDKYEAAHSRFVVFSPTRGVYAGDGLWSGDKGLPTMGRRVFPTYTRAAGQSEITSLSESDVQVNDAQLRVVYPTAQNEAATTTDLNNAGINL